MASANLQLTALPGIPMVQPGDDVGELVTQALARASLTLKDQDVLVVAQKIISKAEGRVVALSDVTPGASARDWAEKTDKDPRLVESLAFENF